MLTQHSPLRCRARNCWKENLSSSRETAAISIKHSQEATKIVFLGCVISSVDIDFRPKASPPTLKMQNEKRQTNLSSQLSWVEAYHWWNAFCFVHVIQWRAKAGLCGHDQQLWLSDSRNSGEFTLEKPPVTLKLFPFWGWALCPTHATKFVFHFREC